MRGVAGRKTLLTVGVIDSLTKHREFVRPKHNEFSSLLPIRRIHMANKTTIEIKHKYIPQPYYKPTLFAIQIFRDEEHYPNYSLGRCCRISYHFFTNGKNAIPKSQFKLKKLGEYVIRYLKSDLDF